MKFENFKYERADIKDIEKKFRNNIKRFNKVESFEEQCEFIDEINEMRCEFDSMSELSIIRKSLGVDRDFYTEENNYYNEAEPILEGLITEYYKELDASRFKDKHIEKYGKQLFDLAKMKVKCVSDEIIGELQEEKKMVTAWVDLWLSFKTTFRDKEYGIWDLYAPKSSDDPIERKEASDALGAMYSDNEKEMQECFDKFVKLRHKMALKMGYENFIEMGYARMNRIGYDRDMVAKFRDQVVQYVVPLNIELSKRQAKRLGVEKLEYQDESVHFLNGNPKLHGDVNTIIEKAIKMYDELSPETGAFFREMAQRGLVDIDAREGKESGGFCAFMPKFKAPFIYTKYEGTISDYNVITHEAGHAFQDYLCSDYGIHEYIMAPMDLSETHSMSMELLTEPWVEEFFGEGADKYKFSHMCNALNLLAYICAVDEFQHHIYEKPFMTPEERNSVWSEMEKKYIPNREYGDNKFNNGNFWMQQGHIFWGPFYYIDYGLSQVVAFNFWEKARVDREAAWADYMKLCKSGGKRSFIDTLEYANLNNVFQEGSLKNIINNIGEWVIDLEEKLR